MVHESEMKTSEARFDSFKDYPPLKKKGSHSKGIKDVKWPHESPAPSEVSHPDSLLQAKLMLKQRSLPTQVSFINPQIEATIIQSAFFATATWMVGNPAITPF